jgi:hypothetical protein
MSDTSLYFGNVIMLGHSLGAYAMPLIADSLEILMGQFYSVQMPEG